MPTLSTVFWCAQCSRYTTGNSTRASLDLAIRGLLLSQPLHATTRISRRLGPQRTAVALKAIEAGDWATACRATLDYYDRCYDHELARSPKRRSVDLTGLSIEQAVEHLITAGVLI